MSAPSLPAAEETLEYVRTLYDFPGNDAEDLPFKKGEIQKKNNKTYGDE